MEKSDDAGARFHAHLDECEQCRNHPFKLCHAGAALLRATAEHRDGGPANAEQIEPPALDEEGFPF